MENRDPVGGYPPRNRLTRIVIFMFLGSSLTLLFGAHLALGENLPGSSQMSKLTAAGDLMKTVDSLIFTIGARLLAGLCVLAGGWNLKEQRFAMAIICLFAAIVIATVPMWVKNLFAISQGSIFNTGG